MITDDGVHSFGCVFDTADITCGLWSSLCNGPVSVCLSVHLLTAAAECRGFAAGCTAGR